MSTTWLQTNKALHIRVSSFKKVFNIPIAQKTFFRVWSGLRSLLCVFIWGRKVVDETWYTLFKHGCHFQRDFIMRIYRENNFNGICSLIWCTYLPQIHYYHTKQKLHYFDRKLKCILEFLTIITVEPLISITLF